MWRAPFFPLSLALQLELWGGEVNPFDPCTYVCYVLHIYTYVYVRSIYDATHKGLVSQHFPAGDLDATERGVVVGCVGGHICPYRKLLGFIFNDARTRPLHTAHTLGRAWVRKRSVGRGGRG